jgi:hypothetical protein
MEDDTSIEDSTELFRRVHPTQVVWDGNKQRLRPTSAAFSDEEMSVNLADDLAAQGLEPEFALRDNPQHHLVSLTAAYVREEEQVVVRSHLPDDPSHGDVVGAKGDGRRKRFALKADWTILQTESLKQSHLSKLEMHNAEVEDEAA